MAKGKTWIKQAIHHPVGSWILACLLWAFCRVIWMTVRVKHHNPPALLRKQTPPSPVILVQWHEFIPAILMLAPPRISVLNSSHGDARILGKAARLVGAKPIWGSSNRSPLAALRHLKEEIETGRHVLITPDGPRGPARQMALGPVALAQLTGAPIMLFAAHCTSAWRLRSWDKTQIPKPFSTVTLYWSEPMKMVRTKDKDQQTQMQTDLEAALNELSARADRGDAA